MIVDISYAYIYLPMFSLFLFLLVAYVGRDFFRRKFTRAWRWFVNRLLSFALGGLLIILLVIIVAPKILISVPSGHHAVVWKRFQGGTVIGCAFPEGTFLLPPWDRAVMYPIRFQVLEFDINAISSEGLSVGINTVVRFRIVPGEVTHLHQKVGTEYAENLVIPEVTAGVRAIFSKYTAEEIYYEKREQIQNEVHRLVRGETLINLDADENKITTIVEVTDKTNEELSVYREETVCGQKGAQMYTAADKQAQSFDEGKRFTRFIAVQDVLLREISLPERVHQAIINKVNQLYLSQEYLNRIEVEKQEAIRKEVEAGGIARFQEVVSNGISPSYLRWKGIEATLKLAESNNAKVVIVGNGKDGLPIILNAESNADKEDSPQASGTSQNNVNNSGQNN